LQRFTIGNTLLPYQEKSGIMKTSRNDPCPCGSGKKFKKCCIDKPEVVPEPSPEMAELMEEAREFDAISDRVPDLVRQGKLDEAEEVCRLLMDEYPQMVDGLERWAMVHEARGNKAAAAEYYRKTYEFMIADGGFDVRTLKYNVDKVMSLVDEGAA